MKLDTAIFKIAILSWTFADVSSTPVFGADASDSDQVSTTLASSTSLPTPEFTQHANNTQPRTDQYGHDEDYYNDW
ncbi:hypothetical protein O5D80_007753 [Batrachochytrium dendrobatidis]|nr:hypothetical protein O5D80_007753 [Batrachochytrium dendrobatidis]